MIASIYKNAKDADNPIYSHVDLILESIRICKLQNKIDALRGEKDKKKRRKLKEALPSICFSGKFTHRDDTTLSDHSGLAIMDIDHIGDIKSVEDRKKEISLLPYVYACFVSPSGDGLKVLVRIPAITSDHRAHYRALMKVFPQSDSTSQNESRICFASCDKNIYINKNAIEFTEKINEEKKEVIYPTFNPTGVSHTDYGKINIAVKMIALADEKHKTLLKASKLMGGYIASGHIGESDAIYALESEISKRDIDDFDLAKKTIRDGIEYGKKSPIFETEEFRQYTPTGKNGIKKPDQTRSDFKPAIIKLEDVYDKMIHGFINGKERGTTTYFQKLDSHYTWKRSDVTLIVGKPGSGKSEWIMQMMLIKSIYEGDKWGAFLPENMPAEEAFDGLIHSYIGKTVDPYYRNGQASRSEYDRAIDFIKDHFYLVYPDEEQTIEVISENFEYLVEKYHISGTLIDPFNQTDDEIDKREDQFLRKILKQRKKFAIKHRTYELITSHPKTMKKAEGGDYEAVDIYDISGGAMWGNKIDNLISIHRPYQVTDPMSTTVQIHIKKIKKQKLVGIPGIIEMDFDRRTNRYSMNGFSPISKSPAVQTEMDIMPPNPHPDNFIESKSIHEYDSPEQLPF